MTFTEYLQTHQWYVNAKDIRHVYLPPDKMHSFLQQFFTQLENEGWHLIEHQKSPYSLYRFCRPHQLQLRVIFHYEENLLSIAWREELSPFLGHLLAYYTLALFALTSLLKLIGFSTGLFPDLLLMVGLLGGLIWILLALERYNRFLKRDDHLSEYFLQDVLRYEDWP